MILKVTSADYAKDMLGVYNSANELFKSPKLYLSDESVFDKQLRHDENYVYESGHQIIGFMSYHEHETYAELTSLYVEHSKQRSGVGKQLLQKFETVSEHPLKVVKVLNNAPWALAFYKKHGYVVCGEVQLQEIGLEQHTWEKILYKIMENGKL